MRFLSIHPTDVPDAHAELIFLLLAHHWQKASDDDTSVAELARAYLDGSIYMEHLPAAFGAMMSVAGKYGVLVTTAGTPERFPAFDAFVETERREFIAVAAGVNEKELVRAWSTQRYERPKILREAELARDYRERHREQHRDTLARARALVGGP